MTIYISGGMSGLPDLNFPAFHAAAAKIRAQGFEVLNPAESPHNDDLTLPWEYYLRQDLKDLLECDQIYMLSGWSKSRGATLERHVASELGFKILGAFA